MAGTHRTYGATRSERVTPLPGDDIVGYPQVSVTPWRPPAWLTVGVQVLLVPADAVMSRGMMRGLAARVSSPGSTANGPQVPSVGAVRICPTTLQRAGMDTW